MLSVFFNVETGQPGHGIPRLAIYQGLRITHFQMKSKTGGQYHVTKISPFLSELCNLCFMGWLKRDEYLWRVFRSEQRYAKRAMLRQIQWSAI